MSDEGSVASDQYHDGNERDVEQKQNTPVESSEAVQDPEIDADAVRVLPGTGGPDDVGDVEVSPDEYHPEG